MILKDLETVGDNKTLKKEIDESGMDRGNLQPPGGLNNLTSLYVPPSSNGTMHGVNNASPANDMEPNSVGSSGNSVFSPRTLTELSQQMPVSSEPQRLSQNNMVHVNPNELLSIKPVNVNEAVARATSAAASNFMSNGMEKNYKPYSYNIYFYYLRLATKFIKCIQFKYKPNGECTNIW
jgi:hypothetical protein